MKISTKIFNSSALLSFFSLFLFINTIHTEVPFTWMLGTYAITHPAYFHLSPINGMLWAEQYTVDHMYRDGDPNSATNKLIKELFYLQQDTVSFRPTILKSKPASYWKPQDIGMIMAAITAYRENKSDDKDDVLRTALEYIMRPQQEIMQTKEEDITARIAAKKEILQDITQQSRIVYTLIGQAERKRRTILSQVNQKIIEIEQLHADQHFLAGSKKPIEQDIKKLQYDRKFINRALQHGITDLTSYFLDSVKESAPDNIETTYTTYATEYILLTLLWKIANPHKDEIPKQDFVDYFNQLGDIVNADNVQAWIVTQPYSRQDHEQLTIDPGMRKYCIAQRYEHAMLATIGRSVWESVTPPIITGAGAVYTLSDGSQTEISPDCVETSFRIFFNIILYNATKIFDIERFITMCQEDTEEIPLKPYAHLIDFYQKYTCVTNLRASEIYNAWADALKGLLGVVYMKPDNYAQRSRFYEVKSCFPNMLKICNHLLFGNNPIINQLPRDKQLDLLCKKVSRDDFMLSWNIVDADVTKDMLADVDYLTLKFLINNTHSFEWHLKKGHSVIPRIDTLNTLS